MTDAPSDTGSDEANVPERSTDVQPKATTERRVPNAPRERCLNCGAPLYGRYCAECGQKDEKRIGPLRHLVAEALDELSLDARLFRTLQRLLHPGFLTRSYLDGRRADFVPPLRLFVIVSFTFLVLFGLDSRIAFRQTDVQDEISAQDSTDEREMMIRIDSLRQQSSWRAHLEVELLQGAVQAQRDPQRIAQTFAGRLSILVFALLPLFAAILKGLYRREYYAAHLVFTLHTHTVAFLAGIFLELWSIVFQFVPAPSWIDRIGQIGFLLATIGILAYTFSALRRTYDESRLRTTLKFGFLTVVYLVILIVGLSVYSIGVVLLL